MPLLWMFGIPFAGFFDLRFINALSPLASPNLPGLVAMFAVLGRHGSDGPPRAQLLNEATPVEYRGRAGPGRAA
jgi:hypothetical protein